MHWKGPVTASICLLIFVSSSGIAVRREGSTLPSVSSLSLSVDRAQVVPVVRGKAMIGFPRYTRCMRVEAVLPRSAVTLTPRVMQNPHPWPKESAKNSPENYSFLPRSPPAALMFL